MVTQSILIGVSGGSGSGKTTFARMLQAALRARLADHDRGWGCSILSQDHYYIDQSARFSGDGSVNFDHPSALDFDLLSRHLAELRQGRSIQVPIYDFVTHTRSAETTDFPAQAVVVLDGTLILSQPDIRRHLRHSIFIDTPEEVRFNRRSRRDQIERGRTPEGIHRQFFGQVKPMHDQFVEPSKAHAEALIPGTGAFDAHIDRWVLAISKAVG